MTDTFDPFGADDLVGYFDDFGFDVVAGDERTQGVLESSYEIFEAAAELGLEGVSQALLIETGSLSATVLAADQSLTVDGIAYRIRGSGPADDDNVRTRVFLVEGP